MTIPSRTSSRMLIMGALGAFGLVLVANTQALSDLSVAWQTEEYSHGLLIPFIAALLAWHLLTEARPVLKPSWLGLAWLGVAALLKLIAALSAFEMAGELSLLLGIIGICVGFLGRSATWVIAPPLFYLIFAIPLPHLIQANLSEKLQLLSSSLGVWPLDALGIPVFQEGNVIDLGGLKLQVVEACSGLRYLFPLLSFGYLVAFMLKDRIWKQLTIFLSAIPITILLNSLRIAFIGVTVDRWGASMAEGLLHDFEGWSVFIICVIVLLGEAFLLRRIGSKGHFRFDYLSLAHGPLFSRVEYNKSPQVGYLLASAFLALLFGSGVIDRRTEIIPPHPALSGFPMSLGDWHGRMSVIEPVVLKELKLSDYVVANFVNDAMVGKLAPLDFYIAYYDQQRVGSATHSPSNCIPGGGWQIEKSIVTTLNLGAGGSLTLTRLLIRRGDAAEVVYYWFDERGRDLTETTEAKWYLLWDSIFMHRTDGALVRLVTPLLSGENEDAADMRLWRFLAVYLPQIKHFIPGKTVPYSVGANE